MPAVWVCSFGFLDEFESFLLSAGIMKKWPALYPGGMDSRIFSEVGFSFDNEKIGEFFQFPKCRTIFRHHIFLPGGWSDWQGPNFPVDPG